MIYYKTGDIVSSNIQTIVNPVNTVGVMGSGLAKQFKEKYPEMFNQYRLLCFSNEFSIGELYIYKVPNIDSYILNFPTKKDWKQPSKLDYISQGLQTFKNQYQQLGITEIAFPKLGCGRGQLNWKQQVKPEMERILDNIPIPIYIYL